MSEKVKIEFEINVPDVEHTEEQLEEWLRFTLGDNGCMGGDNPFGDYEPEPIFGTFEWDEI